VTGSKGRRPGRANLELLEGTGRRLPAGAPKPPRRWLEGAGEHRVYREALAEHRRLVQELEESRTLTLADRGILEIAAGAYGLLLAAERALEKAGVTVTRPSGLLVAHPAVAVRNQERAAYLRALVELGLTPAARSRNHDHPKGDPRVE
jgi:P27 family predicted phage terminase small subunit